MSNYPFKTLEASGDTGAYLKLCYNYIMKCITCSNETTNPKFCNKSCAAKYNNQKFPKRKKTNNCKKCEQEISSARTYCKKCWSGEDRLNIVGRWLSGEIPGGTNYLSDPIRKYLLQQSNYSCSSCGFNKVHPSDGKTILEINHINGDGTDHRLENLEVLCPNCHALTTTYRARNVGNGRPFSYIRRSK